MLEMMKRPFDGLKYLLGIVLLLGVLVNFANVCMRYLFNSSFAWAEEMMSFGLVLCVVGGSVVATAYDKHLKIDLLPNLLPKRGRLFLSIIAHAVWIAGSLYLAKQSYVVTELMMRLSQKSVVLRLPMWLLHGSLFIAFILSALAALYALVRELRPQHEEPGIPRKVDSVPDL